jgi:hypothetical protein
MGGVGGHSLKGANDHCLDPSILHGAGRAGPGLITKAFKSVLGEAPTPLANRIGINSQTSRHSLALLAFGTSQHYPSPKRQGLRRASPRRQ